MRPGDKIKGILLILFGVFSIIFIYNFDTLMAKPADFGSASILGLFTGIIAIINGIRIYRRK